jgi:hypothetical protein
MIATKIAKMIVWHKTYYSEQSAPFPTGNRPEREQGNEYCGNGGGKET